jgi:hypothetical protein
VDTGATGGTGGVGGATWGVEDVSEAVDDGTMRVRVV